jgi:hypothetical protein
MVERKLLLESHVGDVTIVTAKYPKHYETEVLGGGLDGWLVTAKTEQEARYNDKWARSLVKQAGISSGEFSCSCLEELAF